jgi:hypothetical protein
MAGLLDYGAFGTGSPAETAQQPSGMAALLSGAYNAMGLLAKRALGNSANAVGTGVYDPAPVMEAAMLPMGTGGIAGLKMAPNEVAFGAGPIRSTGMAGEKAGNVQETIIGPAIHYNGNVFSGINHAHALDQLAQTIRSTPEAILNSGKIADGGLEGFFTSTGRYVDRKEAARIADMAEQTPHEPKAGRQLIAEDLNPEAEFYSPNTRKLLPSGNR